MYKGKQRCKILKEIRRQIAENNNIEFVTSECHHKGDCLGTCPKCEAELRYLERELDKRVRLGTAVTVAGLAITVTATSITATSCANPLADIGIQGEPDEYIDTAGVPENDITIEEDGLIELQGAPVEIQGEPAPRLYEHPADLLQYDKDEDKAILLRDVLRWYSDASQMRETLSEEWSEFLEESLCDGDTDYYLLNGDTAEEDGQMKYLAVKFAEDGQVQEVFVRIEAIDPQT